MADKIVIDIFRLKTPEQLSKLFGEKDSKLEVGSAAAMSAANACALAHRAALTAQDTAGDNERLAYIVRNLEIVRNYMIYLIDEDVKCRTPINRARKEATQREIDACTQPAASICGEIINMMGQCLDLMDELAELCPVELLHTVGEAAELAFSAVRSARLYILDLVRGCTDETYCYVTRRENEIALGQCEKSRDRILEKVEANLK